MTLALRQREVLKCKTVRDATGADPALDPSGRRADRRNFADAQELKQLLPVDRDKFAAASPKNLLPARGGAA